MKILFIDITSKGIRIPFTNTRIPFAPLAQLLLLSSVPTTKAEEITGSEHVILSKNLHDSFNRITMSLYDSNHLNISPVGTLKAGFPFEISVHLPVVNPDFIQTDTGLEAIENDERNLKNKKGKLLGAYELPYKPSTKTFKPIHELDRIASLLATRNWKSKEAPFSGSSDERGNRKTL